MNKISAVYKIVNTVTNECYVGSSKNVMKRWSTHKCPSRWKEHPHSSMYRDMQKFGIDKFRFQILAPVMPEYLKQVEEEFIEMLQPTYNDRNANSRNVERRKETMKKYWSQLCSYNGETLTLNALCLRFYKAGIKRPTLEAKRYLIEGEE